MHHYSVGKPQLLGRWCVLIKHTSRATSTTTSLAIRAATTCLGVPGLTVTHLGLRSRLRCPLPNCVSARTPSPGLVFFLRVRITGTGRLFFFFVRLLAVAAQSKQLQVACVGAFALYPSSSLSPSWFGHLSMSLKRPASTSKVQPTALWGQRSVAAAQQRSSLPPSPLAFSNMFPFLRRRRSPLTLISF